MTSLKELRPPQTLDQSLKNISVILPRLKLLQQYNLLPKLGKSILNGLEYRSFSQLRHQLYNNSKSLALDEEKRIDFQANILASNDNNVLADIREMRDKIINEGNNLDEVITHFEFFIKFLIQETVQLQCLVANSQSNPTPKEIENKNTFKPRAETYLNKRNFNKGPGTHAFNVSQDSKKSPANHTQLKSTAVKRNVVKKATFTGNDGSKAPKTAKICPMLHQNCGGNSLRSCPIFKKMSVIDRRTIVEKLRLCHSSTTYKYKTKCR